VVAISYEVQRAVIGRFVPAQKMHVNVGSDVWIGDSVILLPGARIGNGAVIGAGSVVVSEIPSYAVAAGVPARVIKKRFSESSIAVLEKLSWWDWSDKERACRAEVFSLSGAALEMRLAEGIDVFSPDGGSEVGL
jgi:virginiamycin A acetyltransferase